MNTCLLNEQADKLINRHTGKEKPSRCHSPSPSLAWTPRSSRWKLFSLQSMQAPGSLPLPWCLPSGGVTCSLSPELPAWACTQACTILQSAREAFLLHKGVSVPRTFLVISLTFHSTPSSPHTLASPVSCVTVIWVLALPLLPDPVLPEGRAPHPIPGHSPWHAVDDTHACWGDWSSLQESGEKSWMRETNLPKDMHSDGGRTGASFQIPGLPAPNPHSCCDHCGQESRAGILSTQESLAFYHLPVNLHWCLTHPGAPRCFLGQIPRSSRSEQGFLFWALGWEIS